MCQIIAKGKDIGIPYNKLSSTANVNPDGFGFMVADRGKLIVNKEFTKRTDLDFLDPLINEELRYEDALIHFRFSTVGNKDLRACHPFKIMDKDKDGVDVGFMHNGTLSNFNKYKDGMPDSFHFGMKIIRPLFKKIINTVGPEKLLTDQLVKAILEEYAGASSRFALLDQYGNKLLINKYDEVDGVNGKLLVSNTYSFNRDHREPVKSYYSSYPGVGHNSNKDNVTNFPKTQTKTSVPSTQTGTTTPKQESTSTTTTSKETQSTERHPLVTEFMDKYDIDFFEEMSVLTKAEFEDIVHNHPILAVDLLHTLFNAYVAKGRED